MNKIYIAAVFAAIAVCLSGCLPSDSAIESQISEARREAYIEWKAMRESGSSQETRINGPLSLNDSVRLALQYNKALQSMILDREVARGQRMSKYQIVLPTFSLTGNAVRVEQGTNGGLANYGLGLTVRQNIMQGNKYPAQLRDARLFSALTDERIRQQVQTLISNVANEYYDVLLAQHMVEVQRDALTSAQTQFRMTSEKRRQETATDADVLRARSEVARYQSAMITYQNAIDTHRVALFKYMGVSQDSEVTFSDQLEFLPMRPVLERAVEIASGQRPDLRIAELEARRYEEAVRIARSDFMPALYASYGASWSEWKRREDIWDKATGRKGSLHGTQQGGLNMSWSFGLDTVGNLESAKAQAKQGRIAVLDAQETMLREIRLQMNMLNNAEETINALMESQTASREALRLVEVGYQAGVRTEVEVTDARSSLTQVIGTYYESINQHAKARVALQVAMGVLGPNRVTDGVQSMPQVPIANIEEFAADDYVPPAPIVMPVPERRSPSIGRSFEDNETTTSQAAPATAPAPAVLAPVAQPVPAAAVTSATSVLYMPPPPESSFEIPARAPVAAPSQQLAPVAPPAPMVSTPASKPEPAAQPLFKITVRQNEEIAQAR